MLKDTILMSSVVLGFLAILGSLGLLATGNSALVAGAFCIGVAFMGVPILVVIAGRA